MAPLQKTSVNKRLRAAFFWCFVYSALAVMLNSSMVPNGHTLGYLAIMCVGCAALGWVIFALFEALHYLLYKEPCGFVFAGSGQLPCRAAEWRKTGFSVLQIIATLVTYVLILKHYLDLSI